MNINNILQDLAMLGWETTRCDNNGITLESHASSLHEGITITRTGLQLKDVKAITSQELVLFYELNKAFNGG